MRLLITPPLSIVVSIYTIQWSNFIFTSQNSSGFLYHALLLTMIHAWLKLPISHLCEQVCMTAQIYCYTWNLLCKWNVMFCLNVALFSFKKENVLCEIGLHVHCCFSFKILMRQYEDELPYFNKIASFFRFFLSISDWLFNWYPIRYEGPLKLIKLIINVRWLSCEWFYTFEPPCFFLGNTLCPLLLSSLTLKIRIFIYSKNNLYLVSSYESSFFFSMMQLVFESKW